MLKKKVQDATVLERNRALRVLAPQWVLIVSRTIFVRLDAQVFNICVQLRVVHVHVNQPLQ